MSLTETLLDSLVKEAGFKSAERARYYCTSVYRDSVLQGKEVLEIGCGLGWLSLYAACEGASRVVGLEPEADGSVGGEVAEFKRMAEKLGLRQIEIRPQTIQDYDPAGRHFDLIVLRASVNHLDEDACIVLKRSQEARDRYVELFRKLHDMMSPEGRIIMTDSSRYNFFGALGVTNPIAPRIEWHKHQSPRVWISLLRRSGFKDPAVTWRMPRALEPLGPVTQNELVGYFLWSRFILIMSRD